ncbi:MAG: hypothetical protein IIC29_08720 [Chloroflexi bacterium]|nr:hypothetical protein [Chloroflexota bacterium]MCH8816796.1 hypothetical protein [Chloroflexota bacterium]
MTIIQRRTFHGKVGSAGDLVTWAHDMYHVIQVNSPDIPFRVLSDYQSGRTDRVVVEIELESMAQLDSALEKTMADPDTQARFESVFERLKSLIDYAEVEHWSVS